MTVSDGIAIDKIIERAKLLSDRLPPSCASSAAVFSDLYSRLSQGLLRLAVLGQFNRGKSTFINSILGREILPVSVIPVTSVPTVITWGTELAATVRFFDTKEPQYQSGNEPEILALLDRYVTEENNPANRHCVAGVAIECPSPLLHGGTVLVDTPGFGSTHVHNTRTTLDYLNECDAALFLLSADLPITQMEIEFLKEVHRHVPRIFFVFNKVDLLNEKDLEKSRRFIETTLKTRLDFINQVHLFPVSAATEILGDSTVETDSGMARVRREIVDFMVQEKFFALAHAIHDKLVSALGSIENDISQRLTEIEAPLAELGETVQRARLSLEACKSRREQLIEQTRVRCAADHGALSEQLTGLNMSLLGSMQEALADACGERNRRIDRTTLVTLLNRLMHDYFLAATTACASAIDERMGTTHTWVVGQLEALALDSNLRGQGTPGSLPRVFFACGNEQTRVVPALAAGTSGFRGIFAPGSARVKVDLGREIDMQIAKAFAVYRTGALAFIDEQIATMQRYMGEQTRFFCARTETKLSQLQTRYDQLAGSSSQSIDQLRSILDECSAIRSILPA